MRLGNDIGGSSDVGMKGSGTRANALWGKGKRRYSLLLAISVLAVAITAGATTTTVTAAPKEAKVPKELRDKADKNPDETFQVIVQTSDTSKLDKLGEAVDKAEKKYPGKAKGLKKKFNKLPTATVEVTGEQLAELASSDDIVSITEDGAIQSTGRYGNSQVWPETVGAQWEKPRGKTTFPTIAIVDSGVEGRGDFGGRLKKQVDLTSGGNNSKGDGLGHGTLVAGLAVGGKAPYTGVEPESDIVSLDVLDDDGAGNVSDAIAACDWILEYKDKYDIRVANFSISGGGGTGVQDDPLDRAVEKLWLSGIVVVAAAGNYAVDGAESGVGYAPANDPFVITVGAADTNGTATPSDDFAAPWSAWGLTQDGFRKPEISAPGRFLNGPVPKNSQMINSGRGKAHKVDDGYMWMSGTSFAAPIVAGAAATVLSRHPDWTPDQVKGALMASASVPDGYDSLGALGVGIVNIAAAIDADGLANPNAGLNRFVSTDEATGLKSFNVDDWMSSAASDPAWNTASWSSASWSSASWSSASWSSASWSSASWSSASWSSASWSSASWSSASWASMFAAE